MSGPSKGLSRSPTSRHSFSPEETLHRPERTTRQTSSFPVFRSSVCPAGSRTTSNPTQSHPADSGVTFTTVPSASGLLLLLTIRSGKLDLLSLQVTALG